MTHSPCRGELARRCVASVAPAGRARPCALPWVDGTDAVDGAAGPFACACSSAADAVFLAHDTVSTNAGTATDNNSRGQFMMIGPRTRELAIVGVGHDRYRRYGGESAIRDAHRKLTAARPRIDGLGSHPHA